MVANGPKGPKWPHYVRDGLGLAASPSFAALSFSNGPETATKGQTAAPRTVKCGLTGCSSVVLHPVRAMAKASTVDLCLMVRHISIEDRSVSSLPISSPGMWLCARVCLCNLCMHVSAMPACIEVCTCMCACVTLLSECSNTPGTRNPNF